MRLNIMISMYPEIPYMSLLVFTGRQMLAVGGDIQVETMILLGNWNSMISNITYKYLPFMFYRISVSRICTPCSYHS